MQSNLSTKQAAEIFLKAAEYIEQYGWQRKGMGVHGKPRCSMGALASAHRKSLWEKKLSERMYTALEKELDGITLSEFNCRAINGVDVVVLFKKTAESMQESL